MKLAEALMERADTQKRMHELVNRIQGDLIIQEGDEAEEDIEALLSEYEQASARLTELIVQINHTNLNTHIDDVSITELLARREVAKMKAGAYRTIAHGATVRNMRYAATEIKMVATVNKREMTERAEALSKEHRELDATIQAANWNTDLIE